MSSVGRGYAQVSARTGFLYVSQYSNHGGFTDAQLNAAVQAHPEYVVGYDSNILNLNDIGSFFNTIANTATNNLNVHDLYRDLGRELHVYQTTASQSATKVGIFRYFQQVKDGGAAPYTEGVGSHPNLWICTWQSAGGDCPTQYLMVKGTRTG